MKRTKLTRNMNRIGALSIAGSMIAACLLFDWTLALIIFFAIIGNNFERKK